MKIADITKAAEMITKNPHAGKVIGYILMGVGAGATITGYGIVQTSNSLLAKQ